LRGQRARQLIRALVHVVQGERMESVDPEWLATYAELINKPATGTPSVADRGK
jgi:hypothetical protein